MSRFILTQRLCRIATLACGFALLIACQTGNVAHSSGKMAAGGASPCRYYQSPRRLANWNTVGRPSFVARDATDDSVVYTPREGNPVTLHRCSQHYHCWTENFQPTCPGQQPSSVERPPGRCPLPADQPLNSWVEIHTVYSWDVRHDNCDPEKLDCCIPGQFPVVVMGYHAKVTADTTPGPVPVLWGPPSAEWSGSDTGPDNPPGSCKPINAKWSFVLGCNVTVGRGQLGLFHHQDRARGIQSPDRLSSDLNRVDAPQR